jgi:flagellar hook assembly protein FlgD
LYDVQGRIIRTLVDEKKPCGTYRAVWDGKDDAGNAVASGSYIARLTQWGCAAGDFPVKITLVK